MSILFSSKLTIVRRSLQLDILKSLITLNFGEYTKNLIPYFQHTVNCSYYFIVGKLNIIYSYCCLESENQLILAKVLEPKFDQKLHMQYTLYGEYRDRGDHFKVVGLKNLASTKKH